MPGAPGVPDKAVGMPNGGAPGAPPGTEAGAAGVPLGEFALLDVDRRRRTGVPEVVFGEGKTSEQIFALLAELRARDPEAPALATRCPAGSWTVRPPVSLAMPYTPITWPARSPSGPCRPRAATCWS